MSLIATDHPLIPASAVGQLEERGYRIYLSTESTLEAGDIEKVLQVIRLEDGEYRVARVPKPSAAGVHGETKVLPEMGEVLKWLEAESRQD